MSSTTLILLAFLDTNSDLAEQMISTIGPFIMILKISLDYPAPGIAAAWMEVAWICLCSCHRD
jgi:hypothetical protein